MPTVVLAVLCEKHFSCYYCPGSKIFHSEMSCFKNNNKNSFFLPEILDDINQTGDAGQIVPSTCPLDAVIPGVCEAGAE